MRVIPKYISKRAQRELLATVQEILREVPLYTPIMPRTGKPFSVRMSNCGPLGWVSDRAGYRYQATHPVTGRRWPPIPEYLLEIWRDLADYPCPPEACLINSYGAGARMGLHQDADEDALDAPVISVSLGDTARFRVGGTERRNSTRSFRLESGDVVILEGASRLAYHGIDRIYPGTCDFLNYEGRINLTLRRVTPASPALS